MVKKEKGKRKKDNKNRLGPKEIKRIIKFKKSN
ncbi:hypothetical protein SAMN04488698_1173 [Candidatus Frackibacter sp. WG12]|nr:MAG: hypothetical protein AWU54_737 [Candidatus Frackibacter sp. T328-2]SDC65801.1 hypothetical protein SAMN04515661_1183 [Candidatus Frackibacter sp. WG11]SEM78944.1 hypothetical protein SAMN04488698_1173 [Candidatus Frackibacter sp. WG12]SFL89713.1 hypothetical protein SAMN04488699_1193 [Candidatus Frackibacter sp. WG13]